VDWQAWWQKLWGGGSEPAEAPVSPRPQSAFQSLRVPPPPEDAARGPFSVSGEPGGQGQATFLRVDGVLDSATADEFEQKLQRYIDAGEVNLVVDFSGVPYVSSRGWGILISVLQNVRKQGGDIRIAGMCANVLKLFYQTGLSSIFEVFEGQSKKRILDDE
jgi:anti-sigma B factor antagonist